MDNVISFTPSELVAFIGTIAGVCAGIATIVGVICKVVMRLKAPEVEQNNRIKALEEENKARKTEIENLEKRLGDGNDRFEGIEEAQRITLKVLQALLAESLGGNATEALKEAKRELDKYFLEASIKHKST